MELLQIQMRISILAQNANSAPLEKRVFPLTKKGREDVIPA